jgi:hypothetical protein
MSIVMMRPSVAAIAVAGAACALASCGGGSKQVVRTRTVITRPVVRVARADEVLAVSALGVFEGRCPRGARSWTLRFANVDEATDTVAYRIGTGPRRTVNIDPGQSIALRLVPGATRTRQPADRFVPPLGQGRGLTQANAVPSTAPLQATIYQGTEPQTLRADVRLALATIGGESGQCVLVGSTVNAYTYPNGP